jgi:hypothetical protein
MLGGCGCGRGLLSPCWQVPHGQAQQATTTAGTESSRATRQPSTTTKVCTLPQVHWATQNGGWASTTPETARMLHAATARAQCWQ